MGELVRNRQEMAHLLNDRMNRTYATLAQERELEPDTSLVKTYLVEAHPDKERGHSEVREVLETAFVSTALGPKAAPEIHDTDDEDLFCVQSTVTAEGRKERVLLYVDVSDARFWTVHSMNSSTSLDYLMRRVITSTQNLDTAWLPSELLETASHCGAFRGLNLDYDRRNIADVDFEAEEGPVQFLKMQLWGNKAGKVLELLRGEGAFPHEATLAKVKVKFWLSRGDDAEFSIDDIKYNGKITARGTSFQSHITLVSDIYRRYAEQILALEDLFSVGSEVKDGRLRITGQPINLLFKRPIQDLAVFAASVFSCSEPFRLWGVPVKLADDFWTVSAVDLHVGSQVNFELAPTFIRIYLPRGSCGNTILRVYTNLQHHYDALVEARIESESSEQLFRF